MKNTILSLSAAAFVLGLAACRNPREAVPAPPDWTAQLQSTDAAERQLALAEARDIGPGVVAPASATLAADDPSLAKSAQTALELVVNHATRPRAKSERESVEYELCRALEAPVPPAARAVLLRELALVAEDPESVELVTEELAAHPRQAGAANEVRDAALFALVRIPGPTAEEALLQLLSADPSDELVPIAAALGRRRSVAAVPRLVALANDDTELGQTARTALSEIGDVRAIGALRAAFQRRAPDNPAADLIRLAAHMEASDAAAAAEVYAELREDRASHVRAAAIGGLARVGSADDTAALIAALGDSDPSVRAAGRAGLCSLDHASTPAVLSAAWVDARGPARSELLRVLSTRGDAGADDAVRSSMDDPDVAVRLTALELAARIDTPEIEAQLRRRCDEGAPEEQLVAARSLLERARKHQAEGDRARALELYHELAERSDSPTVARAALQGVGALGDLSSLDKLEELTPETALAEEVDRTRMAIASALGRSERSRAVSVMEAICTGSTSRSLRQQAALSLGRWGVDTSGYARKNGFLTHWQLCGPLPKPGEGEFQRQPFGPAAGQGEGHDWFAHRTIDVDGIVNLTTCFDETSNVAAFAYTEIEGTGEDVVLKIGSDDGVVVWLNGKIVHSLNVGRGVTVDQDVVPVKLREGPNRLLLKIVQGGGDWGFCVRLCDAEGVPTPH